MLRREFILFAAVAAIAGCSVEEPIQAANPSQLKVRKVDVTLARPDLIEKSLSNWDIGVSKEQLVADVRSAIERETIAVSSKGSRPVVLEMSITGMNLDSAIPEIIKPVFVGISSQMSGRLTIMDARTGEVLIRRNVIGDDIPGEVTFGSAMREQFRRTKSAPQAYRDIVRGFAEDVSRQIFNAAPAESPSSEGTKCRYEKVFNAVRGLYEEKRVCN